MYQEAKCLPQSFSSEDVQLLTEEMEIIII